MSFAFKTEFRNENFDLYFAIKVSEMSEREKEKLPKEAIARIFTSSGKITTKPVPFLIQLYALTRAMNHAVYVVVKDEKNGFNFSDFERFAKDFKRRNVTTELTDIYNTRGEFILGNKEVVDYLEHVNRISVSPAMNYALKLRNSVKKSGESYDHAFNYVCSMITKYEGNKKKVVKHGLCTLPEWYVLLYLSDGKEKKLTPAYTEIFYDAVNASRNQIIRAFKSLAGRNLIQRHAVGRNVDYSITHLGKSMIREIMNKHMIP